MYDMCWQNGFGEIKPIESSKSKSSSLPKIYFQVLLFHFVSVLLNFSFMKTFSSACHNTNTVEQRTGNRRHSI